MKNSLEKLLPNTHKLLTQAGIDFDAISTLLENHLAKRNTRFAPTEEMQIEYISKALSSFRVLEIVDIQKFLAYFDNKKTVSVPQIPLFYTLDFPGDLAVLELTKNTMRNHSDTLLQYKDVYEKNNTDFLESFNSGYLAYYVKVRLTRELQESIKKDVYHEIPFSH